MLALSSIFILERRQPLRHIMSVLSVPTSYRPKLHSSVTEPLPRFTLGEDDLRGLLNRTHRAFLECDSDQSQAVQALEKLFLGLHQHKVNCPSAEWSSHIEQCRQHPVCEQIHQDPFTRRAFYKPRGYAGDAELLDLIYGPEDHRPEPDATPLGKLIYRYTASAPAAEGVRARRAFIADLIDGLTSERPNMEILAIASGHLREADMCAAVRRRRIGRFVALDADPVSLEEVTRCYGHYGVETVAASIRTLLTNRLRLRQFDLIYSTGLFDYLQLETGRRLVTTLFKMLRPGGQLVVANFLPGIRDVGYMEAFMDWSLLYRTRRDMVDLTLDIPESELRDVSLFTEEGRNIIFVKITKQ